MTEKHIRPNKVRKPTVAKISNTTTTTTTTTNNNNTNAPCNDDTTVEQIRVKVEHWMGVKEHKEDTEKETVSFNELAAPSPSLDVPAVPAPEVKGEASTSTNKCNNNPAAIGASSDEHQEIPNRALKSILKKPKYTTTIPTKSIVVNDDRVPNNELRTPQTAKNKSSVFKQDLIRERDPSQPKQHQEGPDKNRAGEFSAMAVEGYEPIMDHNTRIISKEVSKLNGKDTKQAISFPKKDDDDDNEDGRQKSNAQHHEREQETEPLVFNSLADMMEAAGTLPSQNLNDNPQVVEAELAFSCLSPEEYRQELILQGMQQLEEEEEEKKSKKRKENNNYNDCNSNSNSHQQDDSAENQEWKTSSKAPDSMLFEEGYTGSNPVSDEEEEDDDDNGSHGGIGGFFDLMGGDDESEEEALAPPRAFRIIWECLSALITHDSCVFLRRLQREHELDNNGGSSYLITATPKSDLEASRCNGFMTMLRMYIARSLQELQQPMEMRRTAEQRLHGLLYTFNFSRPASKLDTKQWRALTCILLEIVLFLQDASSSSEYASLSLPASVQAVGMTAEEYGYLVRSSIRTFDIPDPVI